MNKDFQYICEEISFSYEKSQSPIFNKYSQVFSSGITILKGYSGCGKTTLLKILAGYLKINSGKLTPPSSINPLSQSFRRDYVSYMFQGLNLLPLFSIEKNLSLCAEMSLMPKDLWLPRMEGLIEDLGLSSLRKKLAKNLSGGQMQRAALARALLKNPKVLLLDEPTSGLDDDNTKVIKQKICEHSQNKICVISSHDARLFEIADEILDFNTYLPR